MNNSNFKMPQSEVERIILALQSNGCDFWLDGGWGVDALMGKQTRDHKDLDICIKLSDSKLVKLLLESIGYKIEKDESPTRLIMTDSVPHRIDLHLLSFDDDGNGHQSYDGGSHLYPAADLDAEGNVGSLAVRCLSPNLQIRFREAYKPNRKSRHDVKVISEKFGLGVPAMDGKNYR